MSDKFKKIWAQMRASYFGPEQLVFELHNGDVLIQTLSSRLDGHGSDGLFCEGSGKTLDEALDNFSKNLDQVLLQEEIE